MEAFLLQFGFFMYTREGAEAMLNDKGSQLTCKDPMVTLEELEEGPASYD